MPKVPKPRKIYSCTHCTHTTKRSHDLKKDLSRIHGEGQGQSRGRESSPERTTPIRTAEQSIITSVPECQRALRKPRVTRRIVSSDSDSSESVVIIEPSNSCTPIDKPKNEKTRKGPTSNGDSKKNKIVRLNMNNRSSESAVAIDNSLNEEIPEGTVNVQPEAALDGEADGYKSKKLRKKFPLELKERKDSNNQNAPPTVEYAFCTACGTQVNPFDRKTFFCQPVLSVVICKKCLKLYNTCLWKKGEDGFEEECRWCGKGGSLSCCDFCCRTFCKRCIMRNLGRAEWNCRKKKWKCYVCEPSPLKELVDRYRKMQDTAIAEEFLQYLVGNISNRALFMRSLVRLKNEVPDMQKLQMNLSLKHIGEVKSALEEFEACVKRQLHGDAHKRDSALDGTNQVDCERPEEKSKSQMEETQVKTQEKEELAGIDEAKEESAMETAEDDGADNNTKPRKKKKCEPEKMELNGTAKWGEGPGEDLSNPEEKSGFDGIPGESSTGSSQDEGGEKEDKVGKVKDLSAVTVTRNSRHSFEASESDSSESKSVNSDDNNYTKPRRRRLSRKKKKCEPEKMDSASEEDMKLKRHEGIRGLKRKCYSATDSDDASENVPDAQDKPEEGKTESVAKRGEEKSDVEKESESEGNPSKKAKKARKSPAKIDLKSRELLSSNSSSDDESNAESDGCSGLRLKSLDKKSKKGDSQEVAEYLLMDELGCHGEEDNNDEDDEGDKDDEDDEDDEDEEVDGEGSKRSENKKAEEDEDWNNSERRQNGTGGGGGIRDGKNGGDDKKKKKKKKTGPYKGTKKSRPWGKKKAQKKANKNEDWNNSARQNGIGGGGGSGDGKNGGDDKRNKGKGQDEGTLKSRPLLITNYSEDDEDEDHTSKKKKGKEVKAAPQKKGKVTKKRRRITIDGVSGEKPKRKRVSSSETASSSEESSVDEGTKVFPLQAAESPDPARMRTPQNKRKTRRAGQLHRKSAKSQKGGRGKRLERLVLLHRSKRKERKQVTRSEIASSTEKNQEEGVRREEPGTSSKADSGQETK